MVLAVQSQGGKESWPAKLGIVKKSRPSIASAAKDKYFKYDPDIERFSIAHRITRYRVILTFLRRLVPPSDNLTIEDFPA